MDAIGDRVRLARKNAGLTQAQLAENTGLSRSYLAGVERSYYNPSVKTLLAIAAETKADLNFLTAMTEIQVKKEDG